jgi:hypothetical protein
MALPPVIRGVLITGVTFTGGFVVTVPPVLNIDTEDYFILTDENGNTFITE